jgi:hypothetical protein
MTSPYADTIRVECAHLGRVGANPRHVEAWMRLEHGTLGHLDKAAFRREVETALALIDAAGDADSESLARSFGL